MTPQEYLETLQTLVRAGQDQAALDFSERFGPDVGPQLTEEQREHEAELAHSAVMSLRIRAWARDRVATEPPARE